MKKITLIRGFKDILPQDTPLWCHVEFIARQVFTSFCFREIRLPILEKTELFKRSIGETTDIVEKEMYTFRDRDEDLLTLRPEATASVVRAFIEHNMNADDQVTRLFTIGPMFRRERPQKGRFRQFHQIDVELIGDEKPQSDAEVIFMLVIFLKNLGISNLSLEINSLGCPLCRPEFSKELVRYLQTVENNICADCQKRIQKNPMRVFDCKMESCNLSVANAPLISAYLCPDCKNHFSELKSCLDDLGLSYSINPAMVRGLDYYVKTAFEVKSNALGAQNALAGGGRYDGLVSFLGGPEIAGIGFAVGLERLLACLPDAEAKIHKTDLFIASLGKRAQRIAFKLACDLRQKGISVAMDYSDRSLKSQMKRADKINCSYTLILGDKEIDENKIELRNMSNKQQQTLPMNSLKDALISIIKER